MKFAPTIAYQVLPNLSVGTSFQINYSTLDLGDGTVAAYSYGVKLGGIYKPIDQLSLGLTSVLLLPTSSSNPDCCSRPM